MKETFNARGTGPVTREILDGLCATNKAANSVELSCFEHSGAPVLLFYQRDTGCLRTYCSVCQRHVIPILVGDFAASLAEAEAEGTA